MANNQDPAPSKTETTYRVTVTKVIRNFPYRDKSYEQVGTQKDDFGNEKPSYEYVYYDDTKDLETQVYRQEVDSIDMPAVIKAVNGMEK